MKETLYLNSINYQRAQQLQEQVGGNITLYRVLDAIIFCWQNSNYQEEGRKIACPKLARLADLASMSVSSVKRQIKKLRELGFIGTKIKKVFNGSTRCFFWVYDIVFDLLGNPNEKKIETGPQANSGAEWVNLSYSSSSNWATPIYKVKNNKEKNNINNNRAMPEINNPIDQQNAVNVNCVANAQVDVALPNSQVAQTVNTEDRVGNTLTKRQHCRINGAINNLIRKEGIPISDPKGLKAQVAFKILLKSDKAGGSNFQHQLNASIKLIREGRWSTPCGYYNHSDEGRAVKTVVVRQSKQWQEQKRQECQAGDFAALATACAKKSCDRTDVVDKQLDNEITAHRSEPAMIATDRVFINGQYMLKSDAKARLDNINENIERYLERARTVSGNLRDIVMDVINRLRSEKQEIAAPMGISGVL